MSTDIASDTSDGKTDHQCVFCFLPLPQILSQPLQVLLDEVLLPKNSYGAPSKENPLACKHRPGRGWTLRLAFCGMHMQEVDVTLEGNGQNWSIPADIEYDILGAQIKSLEKELTQAVVAPKPNPPLFHSIRKHMEWEHAGYYGDKGSILINENLLSLFPEHPSTDKDELLDKLLDALFNEPNAQVPKLPSSRKLENQPGTIFIDPITIHPLSYTNFLTCVLIPFTTILLIQADRSCTFDEAWKTWHGSGPWGSHHSFNEEDTSEASARMMEAVVKPEPVKDCMPTPLYDGWHEVVSTDEEGNPRETLVID
ncbi:hypothetical protein JB92DRAFT_3133253 [Gautieria morchelliformis]|nr:hypothetical protein JB92DRAFT_3133253 [Gautieria morchelliformis]